MTAHEFRAMRQALGWRQVQLAEALGVSERQLRRYETDGDIPRKIALALQALKAGADAPCPS